MGNVHEGGVDPLAQLDDLGAHLVAQLGVQVGEGLIHQEHLGVAHHGAADGHALPLAAGEGLGLALQVLGNVQDLGHLAHLPVDLVLGRLLQLQGEGHVLVHGHVGIEGVVLEDHGDVAVLGRDVVAEPAVDVQLALGDVLQARHHAQRGGLAAAGGADQHDEFLVLDLQVHVVHRGHLVVVNLLQTLDQNFGHDTGPDRPASAKATSRRALSANRITAGLHTAAPQACGFASSFLNVRSAIMWSGEAPLEWS